MIINPLQHGISKPQGAQAHDEVRDTPPPPELLRSTWTGVTGLHASPGLHLHSKSGSIAWLAQATPRARKRYGWGANAEHLTNRESEQSDVPSKFPLQESPQLKLHTPAPRAHHQSRQQRLTTSPSCFPFRKVPRPNHCHTSRDAESRPTNTSMHVAARWLA